MNAEQRVDEIRRRLESVFNPESLLIEDEGHLHAGHAGARDGRGHYRVMLVSEAFSGQGMLSRHRAIYAALGEMMQTDIHALSIEAYAQDEI